ncbi:hypothetical protein L842_6055 [Mycobacterium intracellulare MIN_052511_1280]|nr:hypothetical protein L842_6055 [Mycobacterium intracellulare MIN_052511_1280]
MRAASAALLAASVGPGVRRGYGATGERVLPAAPARAVEPAVGIGGTGGAGAPGCWWHWRTAVWQRRAGGAGGLGCGRHRRTDPVWNGWGTGRGGGEAVPAGGR